MLMRPWEQSSCCSLCRNYSSCEEIRHTTFFLLGEKESDGTLCYHLECFHFLFGINLLCNIKETTFFPNYGMFFDMDHFKTQTKLLHIRHKKTVGPFTSHTCLNRLLNCQWASASVQWYELFHCGCDSPPGSRAGLSRFRALVKMWFGATTSSLI